ncbi:antibiotic biosynthesis monooxygenase [Rubrobacter indicoceani]|uniref:antibiotic biosynthesis monooxygenase n=1 Tax=Rubrobacter indicoceani TaxID=2051957 RepID=UPI000E5C4D48|nr:antibiotic biosynthesis monooxygenase [Rubrobacter indicoceani]
MDEFVDNQDTSLGDDPPVTAVALRRVKPGREQEFEEWVPGIMAAANRFPGYMGSDVFRPTDPGDDEYRIVFRFDHESNMRAWETSDERRHWLEEARPLLQENEKVSMLTGLETWFTLPSKPAEPPPPRYKMALVTWLAVFPLISTIFLALGPVLNLLPTLLRSLILTVIMVSLMTYVVMPRMTRLFSFWLYPNRK